MLTVTSSPSHPPPHRRRPLLHCHLSHSSLPSSRRRSLSHPSPIASLADPSLSLPLDPSPPSDDEDTPLTLHSAPFTLKETSDDSSDPSDAPSDDEDSSSSVSSVSVSTPSKPKQTVGVVGKRQLTAQAHVGQTAHPQYPTWGASEKGGVVPLHRKVVKASTRQHKLSSNYYLPLKASTRSPHSIDSLPSLRAHRGKGSVQPSVSAIPPSLQSPITSSGSLVLADSAESSCLLPEAVPTSSVSRFALLLVFLRRSDGRDKLVKTLYYASNEMRWLMRIVVGKVGQLMNGRSGMGMGMGVMGKGGAGVLSMSMVGRLAAMGVVVGRTLDGMLGAMGAAMGSARQLLRFGRWVVDLDALNVAWKEWQDSRTQPSSSSSSLLPLLSLISAALTVLIDLLDDVEWLAEQLILPSTLSPYAGAASALLWLVSVGMDLPMTAKAVWNGVRGQSVGGEEWRGEVMSLVKLVGDGVYASSLLGAAIGRWSMNEGLAQGGGLVSAVIGLMNFTHKHGSTVSRQRIII